MNRPASKTILVVDDDPLVRSVVVTMLARHGFTILQADNGNLGLQRYSECPEKIDLVLADIAMPGMNGVEMIQKILNISPTARFMFMSGTARGVSMPDHFRKLVLHKPFTMETLLAGVQERLDSAPSRGASSGSMAGL